jgi:hypothetical protein
MVERSLPTLRGGVPASDNAKGWTTVIDEYLSLETDSDGRRGFLIPNLEPLGLWLVGEARAAVARGALRDAAARNGGRFPASLADVPARVPLDPFTGKPFLYEPTADGLSARLSTTAIPGIDEPYLVRIYELTIATE